VFRVIPANGWAESIAVARSGASRILSLTSNEDRLLRSLLTWQAEAFGCITDADINLAADPAARPMDFDAETAIGSARTLTWVP
jgi:hypothetical protein